MNFQEVLFKEAYVLINAAKHNIVGIDNLIEDVERTTKNNDFIVITGVGKNADIAKKIASTYGSIGIPTIYIDAYEALHGDSGVLKKGQLLISLSKSGDTEEICKLFEMANKMEVKLASISCKQNSLCGQITSKHNGHDVVIPCEMEADQFTLAPTCSSVLLLSIGDSIGCVVSYRLGFTKEMFLERHPAGDLGKKLKELCKS